MQHIFKYTINPTNYKTIIEMHEGSEILSAQVQNNEPCLWIRVDTSKKIIKRVFYVLLTGESIIPVDSKFIGTFQIDGGSYVVHIFEGGL